MAATLYPTAAQQLGLAAPGDPSATLDASEEERKKRLLALGRDTLAQNGPGGMGLAASSLLGAFRV